LAVGAGSGPVLARRFASYTIHTAGLACGALRSSGLAWRASAHRCQRCVGACCTSSARRRAVGGRVIAHVAGGAVRVALGAGEAGGAGLARRRASTRLLASGTRRAARARNSGSCVTSFALLARGRSESTVCAHATAGAISRQGRGIGACVARRARRCTSLAIKKRERLEDMQGI